MVCPLPSREVIHITFVISNFQSSSIAVTLHQQVVPAFITDLLLDSNIASILGNGRDPKGEGLSSGGQCLPPKPRPLDCS